MATVQSNVRHQNETGWAVPDVVRHVDESQGIAEIIESLRTLPGILAFAAAGQMRDDDEVKFIISYGDSIQNVTMTGAEYARFRDGEFEVEVNTVSSPDEADARCEGISDGAQAFEPETEPDGIPEIEDYDAASALLEQLSLFDM